MDEDRYYLPGGFYVTPEPEYGHFYVIHELREDKGMIEDKVTGDSSDYYKLPEGATDLQDLIEHKNMSFALGNIFKACYRFGEKATIDKMYDIDKILWFANRIKKELEKENDSV